MKKQFCLQTTTQKLCWSPAFGSKNIMSTILGGSSLLCRFTLTSPISFHTAWFRFPGEHSYHHSDTQVCRG